MLRGETPVILGDGEQARDFTYIDNAVQANLKAAAAPAEKVAGKVFNVACGERHTLNETYAVIAELLGFKQKAQHGPERTGDIRVSFADIRAAREAIGYEPEVEFEEGLRRTVAWYREEFEREAGAAEAMEAQWKGGKLNGSARAWRQRAEACELRVGIIGMGYVGLPLALLFAERGFRVTGFDTDEKKVETLNAGGSYIHRIVPAQIAGGAEGGIQRDGGFRGDSGGGCGADLRADAAGRSAYAGFELDSGDDGGGRAASARRAAGGAGEHDVSGDDGGGGGAGD